ncbi:hypothetical protein [Sphingomonas sp.]|uniref:hypothetical protein n=1 Tax=Sphingomonas sp. TaxID=28214 RepID=UPI0038B14E67
MATLLPFMIIAFVLALRFRSMSKERPLKLGTLWIVPVVYLLLAGSMVFALKPPPMGWGLLIAGLGVGIAIGWHRGKLIRIERNPETGALTQKASPLALVLLVALIVLKLGARSIFGDTAATQPGSSAMLMTDAFLGFALGLLSATRLELYLRAQRLLAAIG